MVYYKGLLKKSLFSHRRHHHQELFSYEFFSVVSEVPKISRFHVAFFSLPDCRERERLQTEISNLISSHLVFELESIFHWGLQKTLLFSVDLS